MASSYQATTLLQTADCMYLVGAVLFLLLTFRDFGYKRCGDDPTVLLPAMLKPSKGGYDLFACCKCCCCCRRDRSRWRRLTDGNEPHRK